MLYLFGGGYVSGCPEFDLPITAALATRGALRIVAPRYALATEHPFPAGLDQSRAVHGALAGDGPLCLAGESAGGGMALAVARGAFSAGKPPSRLALFSPWADLSDAATASCESIDDPTLSTEDLRLYARAYLGATPADDPCASPAILPFPPIWPETLLTTGSRDRLGPQVRALAARMPRARLIDRADMGHVFEAYDEHPEAHETLATAAAFLAG